MKPKIRFQLKDEIVYVNITVPDMEAKPFSLGITLDPGSWDQQKQICGNPDKMAFLIQAKKNLEELYLPGMAAETLFAHYKELINAGREHTVNEAFKYILEHKKMSKSTASSYSVMQRKVIAYGYGDTHITSLTAATVRNLLADIREGEALSEGSIYTYYSHFASTITYYVNSHGLETQGPIEGIMKAPHIDKGKIQYKEDAEVETDKVLDLMNAKLEGHLAIARDLFERQCFTGMSKVDIFAMKTVKSYLVNMDGEPFFEYTRGKTKIACVIPVTDALQKNLDKFVWPIPFGQRTYNNLLAELGEIIGRKLSSHDGRHTFGTIMLEAGFSMETVSKMMGHKSVAITEQCYAKVSKRKVLSERQIALPKLNSIFNL